IVQIHEVGEHDGRPFLALEFVHGGSLASRLAGTPLPPTDAARLVQDLALAVQPAHQIGIVDRDVKPANILLQIADPNLPMEQGVRAEDEPAPALDLQSVVPKITDFGLAKELLSQADQTRTGTVVGTPSYMAPEQARGETKNVGLAADVYAL